MSPGDLKDICLVSETYRVAIHEPSKTPCCATALSLSDATLLALAIENAELRAQLAEAQDQCIELAVDAGELQAEVEGLRAQLSEAERERDAWRDEAKGVQGRAVARG